MSNAQKQEDEWLLVNLDGHYTSEQSARDALASIRHSYGDNRWVMVKIVDNPSEAYISNEVFHANRRDGVAA